MNRRILIGAPKQIGRPGPPGWPRFHTRRNCHGAAPSSSNPPPYVQECSNIACRLVLEASRPGARQLLSGLCRSNERGRVAGMVPASRTRSGLPTPPYRRSRPRARRSTRRPMFFVMHIRFETPIEPHDYSGAPRRQRGPAICRECATRAVRRRCGRNPAVLPASTLLESMPSSRTSRCSPCRCRGSTPEHHFRHGHERARTGCRDSADRQDWRARRFRRTPAGRRTSTHTRSMPRRDMNARGPALGDGPGRSWHSQHSSARVDDDVARAV